MQDFSLVHFWMLGVIGVMAIFFMAAVMGHYYKDKHKK